MGPSDRARVLLVAPHGSYRIGPYVHAAQQLGLEVLIASEGQYALTAHGVAGVHVDLHDPEESVRRLLDAAGGTRFCAVIGTDDAATEIAERLAANLRLPHNPVHAVRIARRKDLARACLAAAGVRVPAHRRIALDRALAPQLEGLEFPVVLKPLALAASRGVMRADTQEELLRACARLTTILAQVRDPEERRYALVERFIPGTEVAVEGILTGGDLEILAIFDKPDPLDGPFFEETYYITPSRLARAVQAEIQIAVQSACRAYGLREGPVHAECRINAEGVWILEVAARTIGGLCARLLRFGTGLTLEELVLHRAAGARIGSPGEHDGAGVLMIPIPQAGILRRVEGVAAAATVPYIEEISIQVREGHELLPLPEGSSYLGFIFARAPGPAQAEAALRAAHACLNVVVAPLWRVVSY